MLTGSTSAASHLRMRSNSGDDIIAAGAFGSIDPSHVAMLFMHSPETPIGKWLEVTQEGRQLHCKGAILKSLTKGQEAATMISKGMITGLSVGFQNQSGDLRQGRWRTADHLRNPSRDFNLCAAEQ